MPVSGSQVEWSDNSFVFFSTPMPMWLRLVDHGRKAEHVAVKALVPSGVTHVQHGMIHTSDPHIASESSESSQSDSSGGLTV